MALSRNISWLRKLPVFLFLFLFLSSCNKNDKEASLPEEIRIVNQFIWENMDVYYLWRDFMPADVNPDKETDPKAFFEKLLYRPEDRWSFITDDYQGLIDMLKGIDLTFGHHFQLFRLPDSNDIVGIVQYVTKNSPAEAADIRRGDLFYKVDGIVLNTGNFKKLLFDRNNYRLTFGDYKDGEIVDTGREITLTAIKMQENPVLLSKVLETGGHKIGYLAYTMFIPDFIDTLKAAFTAFQSSGITDLVLDLRYNPGGTITNARDLSSMIAPRQIVSNNQTLAKFIWNDRLMDYFLEREGEDSENLVLKFEPQEVNLDLDRLFILVSSNTASSSELIINGLKPYMGIILIGPDHTSGKYTGSITLSEPEKHNWAIQPIVLKSANVNGNTDYRVGFMPDYIENDNLHYPLGDPEEDMLAKALELITGTVARKAAAGEKEFHGIPVLSGGRHPNSEMQRMLWNLTLPVQGVNNKLKPYIKVKSY